MTDLARAAATPVASTPKAATRERRQATTYTACNEGATPQRRGNYANETAAIRFSGDSLRLAPPTESDGTR